MARTTIPLTDDEQQELDEALVERADYLPLDELLAGTATSEFYENIQRSLLARGTILLEGPRGCGKTHMMRYAWLRCKEQTNLPLAVYASFNRYYRLEPFLKSRSDAAELFHSWVIANIVRGLQEVVNDLAPTMLDEIFGDISGELLGSIVTRLERGTPLPPDERQVAEGLSIELALDLINTSCQILKRKRCIVLLDDAALTLTPEYLIEFFDIVRVLRTQTTSPKASVYPGTDFGPRFHAHHEADRVSAWLPIDDTNYSIIMEEIGTRRISGPSISPEISEVLKFAAFGIPRAYLTMIRDYIRAARSQHSQQQLINKILEEHVEGRRSEYKSLAIKMPRFETLLETGLQLFEAMIAELKSANNPEREDRQLLVGIPDEDLTSNPLRERMVSLLIEAGLVYKYQSVSHGEHGTYQRYTPHVAALLAERVFSGGSRGYSPKAIVEKLKSKAAKHPVRRKLSSLIGDNQVSTLRLDLPPCRVCKTPRLNDNQRFCHACGSQLLDDSTFTRCMALPLTSVPGLTHWQKQKIAALPRLKTIGDLLASQDPGTELRTIPWVGTKRANRIVTLVTSHVEEFLS